MILMESIGKRLKRLRKLMGLSQTEVAKLINVRRETISRWERESHVPQKICFDSLDKILRNWETLIGMSNKF